MSLIKQIIESDDRASYIRNNMNELTPECIPALIYLFMSGDDSQRKSASAAILDITKKTDINVSVSVMTPAIQKNDQLTHNSNKEIETRNIVLRLNNPSDVTYPLLEYSLHLFSTLADYYKESTQNDALDILDKIFQTPTFVATTQIMLDTTNFLLLFVKRGDDVRTKAYLLLNNVLKIAQQHCDVEVTIAVQSVLYLFPQQR